MPGAKQTIFFQSCLGVFQGGGCRAVALAGAYEEASRRGVRFTEVAGTSAGSIIASLVGAGATPEYVRKALEELDFQNLLQRPNKRFSGRLIGALSAVPGLPDELIAFVAHRGAHSSAKIESWVEDHLRKLLPTAKSPIAFSDLILPTSVLATDLLLRRAKVWSSDDTPDDGVAHAVRASCSIPVFFQPVDDRYVDGGVLSNLPAFVFAQAPGAGRISSTRVLAFALYEGDQDPTEDMSAKGIIFSLANAVVDGNRDIQLAAQREVHVIRIDTGDVKATDFDKMTDKTTADLIRRGVESSERFFDSEIANVRQSESLASPCDGPEEILAAVALLGANSTTQLVVADRDTKWVWQLFPTLFALRARGVEVSAYVLGEADDGAATQRKALLEQLGGAVQIVPTLPVAGFVFDADDDEGAAAIIRIELHGAMTGVRYSGSRTSPAVRALHAQIVGTHVTALPAHVPKLVPVAPADLLARLKTVKQYRSKDVVLRCESVPISQLAALAVCVPESKYRQSRILLSLFESQGIEPFAPAGVQMKDGTVSFMTPPVVEVLGKEGEERFVLIQGTTRSALLRDLGRSTVNCVVVRGVQDALPCEVRDFRRVSVVSRTMTPQERFPELDVKYDHAFRKIERAVRPIGGAL